MEEVTPEVAEGSSSDWRVRLSLSDSDQVQYLYKNPDISSDPKHILYPIHSTDGVIFPYTPTISMAYNANYDTQELTHSNYKMYQYKNSEVGAISLTADFTAQDIFEAKYILGMMYFFKSATKMFYGKDPNAGVPPPLCFLKGYGKHQFNNHPVLISSFTFQMPSDVDYIRVATEYTDETLYGFAKQMTNNPRLTRSKLNYGAEFAPPSFKIRTTEEDTLVPTRLSITLQLLPVVTRRDMANSFSMDKYASGELNQPNRTESKGGMW